MPRGRPRKNTEAGNSGPQARIHGATFADEPGRIGRSFREGLAAVVADMGKRDAMRGTLAEERLKGGFPICHARLVAEATVGARVGKLNREVTLTLECGHVHRTIAAKVSRETQGQYWTHCRTCYGRAMRQVMEF